MGLSPNMQEVMPSMHVGPWKRGVIQQNIPQEMLACSHTLQFPAGLWQLWHSEILWVAFQTGTMTNSGVHGICRVHLFPPFLCADRCFIFRAMAVFRWELATGLFNEFLDLFLGFLHVDIFGDHQALMKNVASKVGTQTTHLNAHVLLR